MKDMMRFTHQRDFRHWARCACGSLLVYPLLSAGATGGTVVAWGNNSHNQLNVPAGLNDVIAVSAGQYHSLALKSDGTVVAWGENGDHQGSVPAGLSNVVAISAGYMHNLALKGDGTVFAWGNNWYNQGSVPESLGLTNIAAISAGYLHNVVLRSNGVAVAWGYGGDGRTTVPAVSDVMGVSAGGNLSMIVRSNGTTMGFGYMAWGSAYGARAVCAGYEHNMALLGTGTVQAWGNATWLQTSVPSALNSVAALAGSHYHCLALRTNGTVVGWGRNDAGQAQAPAWLTNALAISTGELHSLAIRANPTPPSLKLTRSAEEVVLTWPVPQETFVLESTANLGAAFGPESALLVTNVAEQTVTATLPLAGGQKFFRLRRTP